VEIASLCHFLKGFLKIEPPQADFKYSIIFGVPYE